jgi:hypothetical protein
VDHLLMHCEIACALWIAIFSCFGLSWVMPLQVVDLSLAGGRANVLEMLSFGRWCLLTFCGACGGSEMIEL